MPHNQTDRQVDRPLTLQIFNQFAVAGVPNDICVVMACALQRRNPCVD